MKVGYRALRATRMTAVALAVMQGTSCGLSRDPISPTDARINATHHQPVTLNTLPAGKTKLGLGQGRDGYVYVPSSAAQGEPLPLLVMLHGAGRSSSEFDKLLHYADEVGFIILAPDSRDVTWDMRTGFGPDIRFIEAALNYVFDHQRIDASRIAVAGFSDGASYALTIGIANGDLFKRIIAFSPGYFLGGKLIGKPPIFIAHGREDTILSFEYTRDAIIPALQNEGYSVRFEPFDGGHTISDTQAAIAFHWWLTPLAAATGD